MPHSTPPPMPICTSRPRARALEHLLGRTLPRRWPLILPLLALLLVSACAVLEPEPDAADRRALARNRALWERVGPTSYRYVYMPRCGECAPSSQRPTWLTVQSGKVVEATYVDGSDPVLVGPQVYSTVDSLFALVQRAYEAHAAEVRVTYDPSLGYPTEVWIDWRRDIADEEGGFGASSLTAYGALR